MHHLTTVVSSAAFGRGATGRRRLSLRSPAPRSAFEPLLFHESLKQAGSRRLLRGDKCSIRKWQRGRNDMHTQLDMDARALELRARIECAPRPKILSNRSAESIF